MSERPRTSVCMATFDGATHVEEQLRSILDQLGPDDEVVVVDDASSDDTAAVVEGIGDPRVHVHRAEVNLGYAATFGVALGLATGAVLLLADQDDVWPDGRVAALVDALQDHSVAVGNLAVLGTSAPLPGPLGQRAWRLGPSPADHRLAGLRTLLGLAVSNVPYYGSAMGLRADFRAVVLPLPPAARELHDAWIGLCGLAAGSVAHVDAVVTLRRIHSANASGAIGRPRSLRRVLTGRVLFASMVVEAGRRTRQWREGADRSRNRAR